jgi:hypothetical protein
LLRVFTHPELGNIHWLSVYTCQKCQDIGKEQEYLKKMLETKCEECNKYKTLIGRLHKLSNRTNFNPESRTVRKIGKYLEELEKNQEARIQLAELFQRTCLDEKVHIISEYGTDLKLVKCECGQDNSYNCIFEDDFKVDREIIHELSDLFLNYMIHGRLINRAY